MLMLFFVNKPVTFILYSIGLILMYCFSYIDGQYNHDHKYWITGIMLMISFTLFYIPSLLYFFILRGNQKFEVMGVDLKILKRPIQIYFVLYSLVCVVLTIINGRLAFGAGILMIYSIISLVCLQSVITAKFISTGLKQNKELKNFNFGQLYGEIRTIILKRVLE